MTQKAIGKPMSWQAEFRPELVQEFVEAFVEEFRLDAIAKRVKP
jgi:hypothetical protein